MASIITILQEADGSFSSKRVMALSGWIVFLVLCFITIGEEPVFTLATLGSSVLAVSGISAFQTVKMNKDNMDSQQK